MFFEPWKYLKFSSSWLETLECSGFFCTMHHDICIIAYNFFCDFSSRAISKLFHILPSTWQETLIDCKVIKTVKNSYRRPNLTLSAQLNLISPMNNEKHSPSAIKIVSWHLDSFCWFSCIRTIEINCRKKARNHLHRTS